MKKPVVRRSGAKDTDVARRTIALLRSKVQIKVIAEKIRKRNRSETPTRQGVSAVVNGTTRSEPLARDIANVLEWDFEIYFPEYVE